MPSLKIVWKYTALTPSQQKGLEDDVVPVDTLENVLDIHIVFSHF